MNIDKTLDNTTLVIAVSGRLDTDTSPELDAELQNALDGVPELIFDFANLEYISSAGLRVLLQAQKRMNEQGSMVVRGASDEVIEVFGITGFLDFLTVEGISE